MFDALVIGGGPAGASAALRLAGAGWSVALVEKARFPRRKVCGEFISASTLPLLQRLGVDPPYSRLAGPPICRVAVFAGDAVAVAPMPAASAPQPWGRALGREQLDTLLLEQAAQQGVRVFQPWSAVSLQQHSEYVSCEIQRAHPIATRLLQARMAIAAQGSWEPGALPGQRHAREPSAHDLFGFKAHFTGSTLPSDLMPLLAFPGGYGGLVHSDRGRVSLSCCIRRDVLRDCRRRFTGRGAGEAVFEHMKSSCRELEEVMGPARVEGSWLGAGPLSPGMRRLHDDRVFLAGNVAAEAHPVIAEGISLAMQGAWLLAGLLIRHGASLSTHALGCAGREYRHAWLKMFAARMRCSALVATLAMHPGASRWLVPMFRHCPWLLRECARLSGKTRELSEPCATLDT